MIGLKIIAAMGVALLCYAANAQKKVLPIDVKTWEEVSDGLISKDGKWTGYRQGTVESSTFVIQKDGLAYAQIKGPVESPVFDNANQRLYYQSGLDSIYGYDLIKNQVVSMNRARKWKLVEQKTLCYPIFLGLDSVLSVSTGRRILIFNHVTDFTVSSAGNSLIFKKETADHTRETYWLDLETFRSFVISKGEKVINTWFNHSGTACSFATESKDSTRIFYFKPGLIPVVMNSESDKVKPGMSFYGGFFFSQDDRMLLTFWKIPSSLDTTLPKQEKLRIWHTGLTSQRPDDGNPPAEYKIIFDLKTGKKRFETEDDVLNVTTFSDQLVIAKSRKKHLRLNWKASRSTEVSVVSISRRERYVIGDNISERNFSDIKISPDDAYAIYYDAKAKQYLGLSLTTGKRTIISKGLGVAQAGWDGPGDAQSYGVAGWWDKGKVLLYDQHNIWSLDYKESGRPVNLTAGGSKSKDIQYRFASDAEVVRSTRDNSTLLLKGFNRRTKRLGIYRLKLGSGRPPAEVYSGDFSIDEIIKASEADLYLFRSAKVDDAPNYYLTNAFKVVHRISDVKPQQAYNWMSSELLNYDIGDQPGQAVLYKPENFDPEKKYPVIFYFYEKFTDRLNEFIKPEVHGDILNIPHYVSNGYLVCVPDVYYKVGSPGSVSAKSIIAAADYVSKLCYVDSAKMGVQGHSFGGYEVNFLLTQTDKFAAAVAAAGPSDLRSGVFGGIFGIELHEIGQGRMGKDYFSSPEAYLNNSALTFAPRVATPLLLVHGSEDGAVDFRQSEIWFNALRRLGKSVWLLEYRGEAHNLGGEAALDYNKRMFHFFNHYLKGESAQPWLQQTNKLN